MNNVIQLFFLVIVFGIFSISCSKEEPMEEWPPTDFFTTLTINVEHCIQPDCSVIKDVEGLTVELFASLEDAKDNHNRISAVSVDSEGKAIFTVLNRTQVFIRIATEGHGTYISSERFNPQVVNTFHNVTFLSNFIFNDGDQRLLRQSHIGFDYPTPGQKTKYLLYFPNSTNLGSPAQYTSIELEMSVVSQLDESSFVIREQFSDLPSELTSVFNGSQSNVWKFANNNISITALNTQQISSPLLGIFKSASVPTLSFELENCSGNSIDGADLGSINFEQGDCYFLENYTFGGRSFTDVSCYDIHNSLPNHLLIAFTQLKDGFIRSINLNDAENIQYGLDAFAI